MLQHPYRIVVLLIHFMSSRHRQSGHASQPTTALPSFSLASFFSPKKSTPTQAKSETLPSCTSLKMHQTDDHDTQHHQPRRVATAHALPHAATFDSVRDVDDKDGVPDTAGDNEGEELLRMWPE